MIAAALTIPTVAMSPVLFLDRLAASAGGALLEASWQASVLALVVGTLCLAAGDRIPAAWRCVLWGVVFLRLVLPWTPESKFSIYNLVGPQKNSAEPAQNFVGWVDQSAMVRPPASADAMQGSLPERPERAGTSIEAEAATARRPVADAASASPSLRGIVMIALAVVWFIGVLVVLGLLLLGHFRLRRVLRESTLLCDAAAAAMAEECRAALGIAFPVALTENPRVQTPLVLGVVRPALVLPSGLASRLSASELRSVLLHELAHVRRHDILVSWLMSLALALHWFNPLAWIAASRWRAERELACDELALRALREPERTGYGMTLLKLVEHAARPAAFPAVAGIVENNADLKRRIAMIASFRTRSRITGIAMGSVVALALVAGLTNAQPRDVKQDAPATSPFTQGASEVRLYTQAYEKSKTRREDPSDPRKTREIWTLPAGVTLEVLPEYRGVGEKGEKYHDPRITIVAQDRANSFWAMIASLEADDAARFRDELEKAIPERTQMLERLGKKPDDAEVKPAMIEARDKPDQHGGITLQGAARPAVSLRTKSEPILINLSSVPPGAEVRSDFEIELSVPQASTLASALTAELGRRDVIKAISAAGVPTTSGPVAGREIITDHFMFPKSGIRANEFGVLMLPPKAVFEVTSDEKIVDSTGKPGGLDSRVVITLKDPFNKVALVSRVPTADALGVARDIKKLAADKRAAGGVPGNGDSDIVVAPQIYKADNGGMAHRAGVPFMVLPGYNGIGKDGERITDDRITLVINDKANSFWPLVARLDLAVAEKLADDIQRGGGGGKPGADATPRDPVRMRPASNLGGHGEQTFAMRTTRVRFVELDVVPGREAAQYRLPDLAFHATKVRDRVVMSLAERGASQVIVESYMQPAEARSLLHALRASSSVELTAAEFAERFRGMDKEFANVIKMVEAEEAERGPRSVGSVNVRTHYVAESPLLPTDAAGEHLVLGDGFQWSVEPAGTMDFRTVLSLRNPAAEWIVDVRLTREDSIELADQLDVALAR